MTGLRRIGGAVSAFVLAASVLLAVGALHAQSASVAPAGAHIAVPTSTKFFSLRQQAAARDEVEQFVAGHEFPGGTPSSAERSAQAAFWAAVPWKAVYAQWDCREVGTPVVSWSTLPDGLRSPQLSEGHECITTATSAELVPTVLIDQGLVRVDPTPHASKSS